MENALTLYELNSLVVELIDKVMPSSYWVEAEIADARESKGHLYLELIEKDESTNIPIARASAKCWRSSWLMIGPHFERVAGVKLRAGLQIMIQVHAQFHAQYGFSWIIDDINPEYTMGSMARKRNEIIAQLKSEGVFELQRELCLPLFAQRIAVISSASAAGYGDFCNQLQHNEYGFRFQMQLFQAFMQGEQVEQSIVAALNLISTKEDDFDCVVIIRGGGATADLSGFDTLVLAENVANFPLPVITGIGHERDESILDMVAHTRVKTPTAAAAFLIDHLAATLNRIEQAQISIQRMVEHRIQHEKLHLQQLSTHIPILFSMVKNRENARLDDYWHALLQRVMLHLQQSKMRVELLSNKVIPATTNKLMAEQHKLQLLEQRVDGVNPERMLRLGYSLTYKNGYVLRNVNEVKAGDEITTRLEGGIITSVVKK
ncbi:exodeoxyribonuclease VII large subunit [Prevotella pallens]|jgi:exodeoxyribonuclease VII, large subunit|uniref:Exodeoxyribonuclease 7 large subunit n=2 Tax=Prevotella pallens TaxID=60133 RepID=A0ABX9DVS8_9BACT|nr:exodeoxyribonuclease VII large subunit [Prevotella pallens]EGQ17030.1 exodeoxyribonuclease VII large subunit [Prevotella pallens ATCC 700821]MBF1477320.1 exodeoxyribonuclease VII large subunit [Prevotella pallens]MBF1487135.1 exodeoxyribonuclease VII large subunit [Prevotella pallens]MBF1496208.1 exodeoxyribonuclease VII large subunit [Prevotella pallens]MBF1504223.1 exodeoxyribonuclease VII large subunit [Prevotella pallens]